MPNKPPQVFLKFFRWFCHPKLKDSIEGDLMELYEERLKEKGKQNADLKFVRDVLLLFRPSIIKPSEGYQQLNNYGMIKSYIKVSGRSIVRNKLFSAINIVGLSISMSVGLLMITFINDLLSYDDFHEKRDRIYRVTTIDNQIGQPSMNFASTSVESGKQIQETITGVEGLTIMRNGFSGDAHIGESVIPISGLWASESFFKVFTFPLLQGNPATALREPYSLVLTEKSALKLFGTIDAIGKQLKLDTTNYAVTGVMKDIPKLSHIRFEALVSFVTAEIQVPKADPTFLSWDNIYLNYVYLVVSPGGNPKTLQANLDKLSSNENKSLSNREIKLSLQPLDEITVGKQYENEIGFTVTPVTLGILVGLVSIILLSACFNYTNLSIARSLRRSREVGIRKVIGALKSQVRGQFVIEATIISLLALVFSIGFFLLLRVQFFSLDPHLEELVSLNISLRTLLYFILLALIVGILAGFVPSQFFSNIRAIQALKDASSIKVFRHVTMRKMLIVVQYTFSLIFITATIIGYSQYKGFLSFNLGFTTESVLNIDLQGNKSEILIKELSELPEVNLISKSLFITSLGSFQATSVKYLNALDSSMVGMNLVDDNYLTLHKHQFIAGTNFNFRPKKGEEREVIVNEQLLKRFDIAKQDPVKALGEELVIDGKKLVIVGVLNDFHYQTVENPIEPVMFRYYSEDRGGHVNVKIASKNLAATMTDVERVWKKVDKIHPLSAKWYDDQLEEAYSSFLVITKVIGFLAFLAVCIASMGLFGMVVFTTETKLKEISIRKVMGANEGILILFLGKGFLMLLLIAALIALPITYFFFDKVILTNFAHHEPIGLINLFVGSFVVMGFAILMIGLQTFKVAQANPAEVLKNE